MKFILRWLAPSLKFARRKLGGKWYYVELLDSPGGIEGTVRYWTQKVDPQMKVLKEVTY